MRNGMMYVAFSLVLGALFILGGCRENPNNPTVESIVSATDNAIAENEFANIFEYVDDEGANSAVFGKSVGQAELRPACATVTVDSVNRMLTLDFGDENCLGKDGLYRRGKIIAQFIGQYREPGASVVISLEDYFVQDNAVEGTKTIARTSDSSWSVKVSEAEITGPNGDSHSWSSEREVTRIQGHGTFTPWDDIYQYTGSANGINRNGVEYSVTVDEPLIKKIQIGCLKNFVDGVLTISNSRGGTLSVDYDPIGDAPCDKTAEVTINGETRIITLR